MIKAILARIRWNGLSELHQRRHTSRSAAMFNAIQQRFPHLKHPEQIQLKHIRWLKDVWLVQQAYADATQTDYKRTLALLISALE